MQKQSKTRQKVSKVDKWANKLCKQQFLKWLKKELVKYWGERCDEYEYGCPLCEAYKMFDKLK